MTPAELKTFKRLMKSIGASGGFARARKLTAERRQEIARKAAQARWGKPKKVKAEPCSLRSGLSGRNGDRRIRPHGCSDLCSPSDPMRRVCGHVRKALMGSMHNGRVDDRASPPQRRRGQRS